MKQCPLVRQETITYLNFELAVEHGLEAIVPDELEVEIEVLREEDPVGLGVAEQDLRLLYGIPDHVALGEPVVDQHGVHRSLVHRACPVEVLLLRNVTAQNLRRYFSSVHDVAFLSSCSRSDPA